MRICIYGAGAMGTSLGVLLEKSGTQCELVSRNERRIASLRQNGAVLLSQGAEIRIPVTAYLPAEMPGQYDFIFLATKQRDNRPIAEFLLPYLKEDGALITVQNGLPEQTLAEVLGENRVYGCTLSWGAELTDSNAVQTTSTSGYHIALGAYGAGSRLTELKEMLGKAAELTVGNLKEIRYAKLAINGCFSTLSAISGLPFGEIAKKQKKITIMLMREIFAVAKADGCQKLPLNGHDLFRVFGGFWGRFLLPVAMKKYKVTRSGMLKDLENGRRCDVDSVAGAAVKVGERLGIETPMLSRAAALVHEIENGFAEIAPESLALIK